MNQDASRLTQQIADLVSDDPQGNEIRANVSGSVAKSSAAPFHNAPLLNPDNTGIYSQRPKFAMGFGFFPQSKRHFHAEAMGIQTRSIAWERIGGRATGHLPDPQWPRADLVGDIGVIYSRIS